MKERISYYLTVSTWIGLAPGARHFYGRIRWYNENHETQSEDVQHTASELCRHCCYYKIHGGDFTQPSGYQRKDGNPPGCSICEKGWVTGLTGVFENRKELVKSAKLWFRTKAKKTDILFNGGIESGDPIEILCGPAEFKKRGNALWKQAVKIDYYENNEKKMNKISKAWEDLMQAWGIY